MMNQTIPIANSIPPALTSITFSLIKCYEIGKLENKGKESRKKKRRTRKEERKKEKKERKEKNEEKSDVLTKIGRNSFSIE